MATTRKGFGQTSSYIKIKRTRMGSGTTAALIKNPSSIPIKSTPISSYSNFADFCKTTASTEGNNLIGKTFHYLSGSQINVEHGFTKPKCYSAVITSVNRVACEGSQNTGIDVNLTWTDEKGKKNAETGVIYQGWDDPREEDSDRWMFPNFHVSNHNPLMYPVPGAHLSLYPPGTILEDNSGGPFDPYAPPSATYTGCSGITANQPGVVTWICWCNGVETYREDGTPRTDGAAITAAHGNCQDSYDGTGGGVPESFNKSLLANTWIRNIGEQQPIFLTGHVEEPYEAIEATLGTSLSVHGLSDIVKPWVFDPSKMFFNTGSYIFSYIKLEFNVTSPNNGHVYLGLYQTYNQQNYWIVGTVVNGASSIDYYTPVKAPTFGPPFVSSDIKIQVGLEIKDRALRLPLHFFIAGKQVLYEEIQGLSWNNAGKFVEIGVQLKRNYGDQFTVQPILFSNLQYIANVVNLNPDNGIPVWTDWDAFIAGLTLSQRFSAFYGRIGTKVIICGDAYSNNERKFEENVSRCDNCDC